MGELEDTVAVPPLPPPAPPPREEGPGPDDPDVEPPAPVPLAVREGERHRYGRIPIHGADGVEIGYMLHHEHQSCFDVHCARHVDCSIGRSHIPWNGLGRATELRLAKGRGLAFLVAWCRLGVDLAEDDAGRSQHMEMRWCRDGRARLELGDSNSDLRQDARLYVEGHPELAGFRRLERQARPGEGIEPRGRVP